MKNYITKVIMFILMSVAAGVVPATAEAAVKLQVPTAKVEKVTNSSVTIKVTKGANTKVVKKKGKKQYDKITGLQIYRRVKGGTFRKVSTIKVVKGKISKSKKYTGLKSNTFYGFRIRTYKKEGKKIYYSKWYTFGVTTKKGNSGSGNSEDQKKEENVNSNKNNSTTQAGMEDCATMNERYRNYTVEEMDAIFNADYQQKTVDKVNMLRMNRGLAPYKLDATLCQLAEQRAKEEVEMQTWLTVNSRNYTHWRDTSKQRYWLTVFEDFGVTNIKPSSENVNWGGVNPYFGENYSSLDDIDNYLDVFGDTNIVKEFWEKENYKAVYTNSWLFSLGRFVESNDGHRKALLQNSVYTDCMGVAYVWNEDKTSSVWVEIFGKYR